MHKWRCTTVIWAVLVVLLIHTVDSILNQGIGSYVHNDFSHYYLSSCLVRSDPAAVYTTPLSSSLRAEQFDLDSFISVATNPPVMLLATYSLCSMEPEIAWWFWKVLNFILVIASVFVFSSILGLTGGKFLICVFLYTLSAPLYSAIFYSQISILLAFLLLLVVAASAKRQAVLAGLILGFALSLKYIGFPLLIFYAARREKMICLSGVMVFLLFSILPLIFLDPGIWVDWLRSGLPTIIELAEADRLNMGLYQPINGLVGYFYPSALLGKVVFGLLVGAVSLLFIYLSSRWNRDPIVSALCMAALSFTLMGTVWYHYMLLPTLLISALFVQSVYKGELMKVYILSLISLLLLSNAYLVDLEGAGLYVQSVWQIAFITIWNVSLLAFLRFADLSQSPLISANRV